MVNGPPCATCGSPLRWIVERNAWGCDRCRTIQGQGQPGPQAQPQQSGLAPPTFGVPQGTMVGYGAPQMPSYAPAAPGSFAGGNARTPSVAPGSYAAPAGAAPYAPGPAYAQNPAYGANAPAFPAANAPGFIPPPNIAPPIGPSPYPVVQRSPHGASGYQPPGAPPPVAAAAIAPTVAKRSNKKLFIGIGVVLAIGAGVTVAVVMSGGDSTSSGGGVASRDELATQTVAAISAGDVDALLALAGPEDMQSRFSDCKPPEQGEPGDRLPAGDPAKAREELRKSYQKIIDDAKGIKAELVQVTGDDKTELEKGKVVGRCTMKTTVGMYAVKAKVKVAKGQSKGKDIATTMSFMEIDGSWYLAAAPSIKVTTDCAGAIAKSTKATQDTLKKLELGPASAARVEKKLVEHCVEDGWGDDVVDCMAVAETEGDSDRCLKKLPAAQRDKLTKNLTAILEQELKNKVPVEPAAGKPAAGEPLPTEEPAAAGSAAASADELPVICDDYGEQIAKIQKCKKLSATQRKQIKESFDTLKQGWNDIQTKNAAMRESFEKTCKLGVDQIVELRKLCR